MTQEKDIVELVGGPLCGTTMEIDSDEKEFKVDWLYGKAIYVYEGQGKAVYKKNQN